MFPNTLTANEKYLFLDYVNLSSPIEMQSSIKPTIVSDFFVLSFEFKSNFKYFEKKDDRHTYFISEIGECEKLGQTTI